MTSRITICSMLVGGDRRSIGRSNEVAELVIKNPKRAIELFQCLWDSDSSTRMRAADAMEKLSRNHATLLQPFKTQLLGLLAGAVQQEMRWHLALTIPRLRLTVPECHQVAELLQTYLQDRSSIVKTFAMQALSELTIQDDGLRPMVIEIILSLTRTGTPAMRARGRILLKQLKPV